MDRKYKDGVCLKTKFNTETTYFAKVNGYVVWPNGREFYSVLLLTECVDSLFDDDYRIERKLIPPEKFDSWPYKWQEITEDEFNLQIEITVDYAYHAINATEEKKAKMHNDLEEYKQKIHEALKRYEERQKEHKKKNEPIKDTVKYEKN